MSSNSPKININKYIFATKKIENSKILINRRKSIIDEYSELKEEYYILCSDFEEISNIIIHEQKNDYDYNYYLACVNALVEINYQMHEIECKKNIMQNDKKELNNLFKLTRSNISPFKGIRSIMTMLIISVLILIFIINTINSFLSTIEFKNFIDGYTTNQYINDFIYSIIYLLICLVSIAMILIFITPVLNKFLTKHRIYREEQRSTLYQILGIIFTILFVVWAFFFKS